MKEAIIEILRASAQDGKIRRRDVVSFALILIAPALGIAGAVTGTGAAQQTLTLAAILAFTISMRLVVKPSGAARAAYIISVVAATLTLVGGASALLNGGGLSLEPAGAALLFAAGALFAEHLKGSPATGTGAPSHSAG